MVVWIDVWSLDVDIGSLGGCLVIRFLIKVVGWTFGY